MNIAQQLNRNKKSVKSLSSMDKSKSNKKYNPFQKMLPKTAKPSSSSNRPVRKQKRSPHSVTTANVLESLPTESSTSVCTSSSTCITTTSASNFDSSVSFSSVSSDISNPLMHCRNASWDSRDKFFSTYEEDENESECDDQSAAALREPASACAFVPQIVESNEKRRRIRFNETVSIGTIPNLDRYTDSEIQTLYYSAEEEAALRAETKAIVRSIKSNRASILDQNNEEYCSRGLENYILSRDEKHARRAAALEIIYAVLEEQEEQWRNSYTDDSAIAIVSLIRSKKSRMVALELAAKDEAEVLITVQETVQPTSEAIHRMALTSNAQESSASKIIKSSVKRRTSPIPQVNASNTSVRALCA